MSAMPYGGVSEKEADALIREALHDANSGEPPVSIDAMVYLLCKDAYEVEYVQRSRLVRGIDMAPLPEDIDRMRTLDAIRTLLERCKYEPWKVKRWLDDIDKSNKEKIAAAERAEGVRQPMKRNF